MHVLLWVPLRSGVFSGLSWNPVWQHVARVVNTIAVGANGHHTTVFVLWQDWRDMTWAELCSAVVWALFHWLWATAVGRKEEFDPCQLEKNYFVNMGDVLLSLVSSRKWKLALVDCSWFTLLELPFMLSGVVVFSLVFSLSAEFLGSKSL